MYMQFYLLHEVALKQLEALRHVRAIVYLLHFSGKLGNPDNPRAQAQHYIGWCVDLHRRMTDHYAGPPRGAHLVYAAFHNYQFDVTVARLWEGDWTVEQWLKGNKNMGFPGIKNAPSLCPECNPTTWMNKAAVFPGIPSIGEDFPDIQISTKMDGYEAFRTQKFRQARGVPPPTDRLDDDLL